MNHKYLYRLLLVVMASVLIFNIIHASVVEIENDYILISVDDMSGRFMLETVEGNPDSELDDDKILLYKKIPPSSFTTVVIDGEEFVFGSSDGTYKQRATVEDDAIITEWQIRGINIVQEVEIVTGPSTGLEDTMRVKYKINNQNNRSVEVGLRILFDTFLGDIEGPAFRIPGIGEIENETQYYRDELPEYWYSFDDYDEPSVRSMGVLKGYGVTTPDRLVFASWENFLDNPWEFAIDSTQELKEIGSSRYDSAVALYYEELEIESEETIIYTALYGMYGVEVLSSDDLKLSLSVPAEPKAPPVSVSALAENLSDNELDSMTFEITVPEGFSLESDESNAVTYLKVSSGQSKEAVWNLESGSIGGQFDVEVEVTAIEGENVQSISGSQSFKINYNENIVLTTDDDDKEVLEKQMEEKVEKAIATNTNIIVETESTNKIAENVEVDVEIEEDEDEEAPEIYVFSELELQILEDVDELSALIEEVDKKYQVLMGIYNNSYLTNKMLDSIDEEIEYYESLVEEAELSYSNQIMNMQSGNYTTNNSTKNVTNVTNED